MHVYKPESKDRHVLFVQPANEIDNSEWRDNDGNPILFQVEFINGKADVADNLGQYLLDNHLAQRTSILMRPAPQIIT